jgi:hypothetical protein
MSKKQANIKIATLARVRAAERRRLQDAFDKLSVYQDALTRQEWFFVRSLRKDYHVRALTEDEEKSLYELAQRFDEGEKELIIRNYN